MTCNYVVSRCCWPEPVLQSPRTVCRFGKATPLFINWGSFCAYNKGHTIWGLSWSPRFLETPVLRLVSGSETGNPEITYRIGLFSDYKEPGKYSYYTLVVACLGSYPKHDGRKPRNKSPNNTFVNMYMYVYIYIYRISVYIYIYINIRVSIY